MPELDVSLESVTKTFSPERRGGPSFLALDRVSLSAHRGEILVVVGPSGCGKSTTLRVIAGLEAPDFGEVTIAGQSMQGIAPQDRDVAMVFQGYARGSDRTAARASRHRRLP